MTGRRSGVGGTLRNLGWLVAGRGTQAVLSLGYLAIATRALGITDFGRFALVTGAAQALITFVGFPTWQIVIQFGTDHLLRGDDAALGRLLRGCAALDAGAALLGSAIVAGVVALFARPLGLGAGLAAPVLAFAVVQLLTLRSTALGILRLRDQYARAAWADATTSLVRFAGAGLVGWLWPTVAGFLLVWAVAEVATAAAFWAAAARTRDLARMARARVTPSGLAAENPGFFRFAINSNANVTLGLSEKQLPLLVVGAFVGPAAAGGFRVAFQLAQALSKLAQMLTRAAFPDLVRAVRTAGRDRIAAMLGRTLLVSTGAAVLILAAVLAAGGKLLAVVGGRDYASAYPILAWLALAGCLDLATVGFEPVLMALHRAGTAFLARAISGVALVGAMLWLTPAHGAVGTAIAVVIGAVASETLLAIATVRAVRRSEPPSRGEV